MAVPKETRQLVLKKRPSGMFANDDFAIETRPLPELSDGQILFKVEFASMDPTHRIWASSAPQYYEPVKLDDAMRCMMAGKVVASKNPEIPVGAYGWGSGGLGEYAIVDQFVVTGAKTVQDQLHSLSTAGIIIGLTAYVSAEILLQPKEGDTVFVTGAAGAVGRLVCQFALLRGAKVIGTTGSPEKAAELKELGVHPILYKTEDVSARLKELAPNGINCFHENVGGPVSRATMPHMALNSKIALCGLIDGYNNEETESGAIMENYQFILHRRITLRGFICSDYADKMPEFMQFVLPKLASGQIKDKVDVREGGLEAYVPTINNLFTGGNRGKLVLKIAEPSLPSQ